MSADRYIELEVWMESKELANLVIRFLICPSVRSARRSL
jgi:hypothetical protein